MQNLLAGQRVLITQAHDFMGPVFCEVFAEQGATVVASPDALSEPDAAERVVRAAGTIDVLVANLAYPAPTTAAADVGEQEWRDAFAALVDQLPRLVRAATPAMVARRSGKVLVIGSASALRGMKRASTYSAARGA
jgi:2-keto-3-deoxy-L-fuconate dehydrogenase